MAAVLVERVPPNRLRLTLSDAKFILIRGNVTSVIITEEEGRVLQAVLGELLNDPKLATARSLTP